MTPSRALLKCPMCHRSPGQLQLDQDIHPDGSAQRVFECAGCGKTYIAVYAAPRIEKWGRRYCPRRKG